MEYLLECFRTAREELLHRVKHRDNYLKLHLVVQGILLGLSMNVKIAGVEPPSSVPLALYLSVPLTAVFALLYYTEDRLIGHIGSYIGSLSKIAVERGYTHFRIDNWDVSPQLREYAKTTLVYRFLAHLAAFVLAPSILLYYYSRLSGQWTNFKSVGLAIEIVILISLAALSVKEYLFRRKTGKEWKGNTEQVAQEGRG